FLAPGRRLTCPIWDTCPGGPAPVTAAGAQNYAPGCFNFPIWESSSTQRPIVDTGVLVALLMRSSVQPRNFRGCLKNASGNIPVSEAKRSPKWKRCHLGNDVSEIRHLPAGVAFATRTPFPRPPRSP